MKTLVMVTALSLPLVAAADPLPRPVEGMACLVGTWKGSGTIAMGAASGKVALTSTSTALTCSGTACAAVDAVVDLVGYGSATGYAGTGPAPAASSTSSVAAAGRILAAIKLVFRMACGSEAKTMPPGYSA